jgi:DNA-binding transcriptional MerR regulator
MAEENLTSFEGDKTIVPGSEEDVLAEAKSGEEFLRHEEEESEVVEGFEPVHEVNMQHVQERRDSLHEKQARLQEEINTCQAQINGLANQMETAQLAFQQCVVLLQVQEKIDGS